MRVWLLLVGLVCSLACGGGSPEPSPGVASDPATFPTAAPATEEAAREAATRLRADPTEAYLADCHAKLPPDPTIVWDEVFPPAGDECSFREFQQNCAPDMAGCWERSEACSDACATPCATCQDTCAGACEGCKAACGGDASCARRCASERATCRATCVTQLEACRGPACAAVYSKCEADAEERKLRLCPSCVGLAECAMTAMSEGTDWQACAAKFPGDDPECVSLCFPGW